MYFPKLHFLPQTAKKRQKTWKTFSPFPPFSYFNRRQRYRRIFFCHLFRRTRNPFFASGLPQRPTHPLQFRENFLIKTKLLHTQKHPKKLFATYQKLVCFCIYMYVGYRWQNSGPRTHPFLLNALKHPSWVIDIFTCTKYKRMHIVGVKAGRLGVRKEPGTEKD